jgi:hypothetical protein
MTNFDDDDDENVCIYKSQRKGVTKSILYTFPYRPAKKAQVQKISMITNFGCA